MNFWSTVLRLSEKDVRVELRSKETLYSTLLFVVLVLIIFNFAFHATPEMIGKLAPGILWVVIAFSGTIAISHLSHIDRDDRTQDGLLLAGCTGTTLFFAKFVTALLFMLAIESVTLPLFMIFFNFAIGDWLVLLFTVLALGSIGYAAVGTLLSTLLSQARFRDLLLPIIFYPVIVPLLIAAVKATSAIIQGDTPQELTLMVGFDIIFLTAAALLFDFVVEDSS